MLYSNVVFATENFWSGLRDFDNLNGS